METTELHNKYVIIYFNESGSSRQVIHPSVKFDGDWRALVNQVTDGVYHSFKIM
jgi:hypothetical protein